MVNMVDGYQAADLLAQGGGSGGDIKMTLTR